MLKFNILGDCLNVLKIVFGGVWEGGWIELWKFFAHRGKDWKKEWNSLVETIYHEIMTDIAKKQSIEFQK